MRSVSKRQKAHDPEAVCSVTSFTARPMLRVGGKDKGTRFLSFVDAMIGFRHLLTAEDLNKAASLCTSMRGQLQSKFIVLSDDKVLPPPPNTKRKRTLSGGHDQHQGQPAKNSRPGGNSNSSRVQAAQPGTSAGVAPSSGFQVVDQSRKKKLPEGVTPIQKRTTPRRAAKETVSKEQDREQGTSLGDERMSEGSIVD